MAERGQRTTLRPLVLLEAATLLSGAGNGAALVLLPWIALERTGEASAAGLLAAATALPLLVSSLLSGTIVDRLGVLGEQPNTRVVLAADHDRFVAMLREACSRPVG